MIVSRRRFIKLGALFFGAPAIVRASSLMPVTPIPESVVLLPGEIGRYNGVRWIEHQRDYLSDDEFLAIREILNKNTISPDQNGDYTVVFRHFSQWGEWVDIDE